MSTSTGKHFFSLKWKAILSISLILVAINGTLATILYLRTVDQLEQQQQKIRIQQDRELESLLHSGIQGMQNLAELLPLTHPEEIGGAQGSTVMQVGRLVEQYGDYLAAAWGVRQIFVYARDGELLFSWPREAVAGNQAFIREVAEKEIPVDRLICDSATCNQRISVPILEPSGQVNVLVMVNSLVDILRNYIELSGADISILSASEQAVAKPSQRIRLSSRSRFVGSVLDSLDAAQLETLFSDDFVRTRYGGEWYELHLNRHEYAKNRNLFLITNRISQLVDGLRSTATTSVFIGLLGLAITESILLLLIWGPTSQLQRLARYIPLLAEGNFVRFRRSLHKYHKDTWTTDEIDVVEANIISASAQLEVLQYEKNEQAVALERERDFVNELLDSAPVAVLILDRNYRILRVNQMTGIITGRDEADLCGSHFPDLFEPGANRDGIAQDVRQWLESDSVSYQHEAVVRTPNDEVRTINWTHSRIGTPGEDGSAILVVGLDLTQRIKAEKQLSWMASHDSLTELYNRRYFQSAFERILAEHREQKQEGALLFFDLDQFKYVNDVSGHHAGDMLINMVATRLEQIVRDVDVLARLGGDEFAVILPRTDEAEAVAVAQRVLEILAKTTLPIDQYNHKVSASIGIALFPKHGSSAGLVMANADIAMYHAKEKGRGRWYVYSPDDQTMELLSRKATWREKIDKALERERFVLYFQPILDIRANRISHCETLIRMLGEDDELIYPDRFIPIAEQTGQIAAIDRWVVRSAIRCLGTFPDLYLTVNLSGNAIGDQGLAAMIECQLAEHQVEAQRLTFEITETAAVQNIVAATSIMHDINALGCQFALDDFGTGFSSFNYLKQLPASIVKIDGAFIKDLAHSKEDQLFVRALTDVSRGMGKKTIAEFVESREILQILTYIGVDYAQGYHIGRPSLELECHLGAEFQERDAHNRGMTLGDLDRGA